MKSIIVCSVILSLFLVISSLSIFSEESSARPANDDLSMSLYDNNGKTLSKVSMSYEDAILDSDVRSGKLTYYLKCESPVTKLPSSLLIDADGGTYQVDVFVIGLQNTQYAAYGVRMFLDNEFFGDLTVSNSFKTSLVNSDGVSKLIPDHKYAVSLYSKESGELIPSDSLQDIVITFSWYASQGTHVILFVDENVNFGMIITTEGASVKLFSPTGGKEFDYWMDQDNKIYEPGSIITVDSDMVMYAAWGEDNPIPTILFSGTYIVILIVFFATCGCFYGAYKH